MDDFLQDCFFEALSPDNIKNYWLNRVSDADMITVNSDLPIRNKRNSIGTRNIELLLQTQYGLFSKTIALIENGDIIIPQEFGTIASQIDFGNFKKYNFKREINVMIGAFSLETLFYAVTMEDVDSYESNGIQFELLKAFDGTMQCFVKELSGLDAFSPLATIMHSELDGKPISAFKFDNQQTSIFPTHDSHEWLERLSPQRLMQVFNLEK